MPHVFPNEDGNGLIILLAEVEFDLLNMMPRQLRELVGNTDFNNRMVERLFPRASDDESVNIEFMAYAGEDVRSRKLEGIEAFEQSLATAEQIKGTPGVMLQLDNERIDHWLAFTNDMRLMIGTDLGIDSNTWYEENAEELVSDQRLWLYEFLSQLQSMLLEANPGFEV